MLLNKSPKNLYEIILILLLKVKKSRKSVKKSPHNIFFENEWFYMKQGQGQVMVLNTTFNNISAISWQSVLLVDWRKPEYPEKTTDQWQVTDKFYHIILTILFTLQNSVKPGAVLAMIVCQDLQLLMQSVPITTDVVSSNIYQGKVYNII